MNPYDFAVQMSRDGEKLIISREMRATAHQTHPPAVNGVGI